MRQMIILLLLIFAQLSWLHAEDSVVLSFSIQPDHTLPGLPVSFSLEIKNLSASSIETANSFLLKVTPKDQKPFIAKFGASGYIGRIDARIDKDEEWKDKIEIGPNQQRKFIIPIDVTLSSVGWFFDERLSWPGTYRLCVILEPNPVESLHGGLLIKSENEPSNIAVLSNEATLTIDKPLGEDLLVWQRMIELSHGKGWGGDEWVNMGFALAKEIWEKHAASEYIPYIAAMVPYSVEEKVIILETVVARYPQHSFALIAYRSLADIFENKMTYALMVLKDKSLARNFFDLRKARLEKLLQLTNDPAAKEKIQREINRSWSEILEKSKNL